MTSNTVVLPTVHAISFYKLIFRLGAIYITLRLNKEKYFTSTNFKIHSKNRTKACTSTAQNALNWVLIEVNNEKTNTSQQTIGYKNSKQFNIGLHTITQGHVSR